MNKLYDGGAILLIACLLAGVASGIANGLRLREAKRNGGSTVVNPDSIVSTWCRQYRYPLGEENDCGYPSRAMCEAGRIGSPNPFVCFSKN